MCKRIGDKLGISVPILLLMIKYAASLIYSNLRVCVMLLLHSSYEEPRRHFSNCISHLYGERANTSKRGYRTHHWPCHVGILSIHCTAESCLLYSGIKAAVLQSIT